MVDILAEASAMPLAIDTASLPHSALLGTAIGTAVATTATATTVATTAAAGLSTGAMVGIGAEVIAIGAGATKLATNSSSSASTPTIPTPITPTIPIVKPEEPKVPVIPIVKPEEPKVPVETTTSQRVASIKNASGTTTQTFEYDANGNIVKETSWDELSKEYDTTVYKYDASGHMISSEADKIGHDGISDERTSYITDANGNILTEKTYDIKTGYIKHSTVNTYDSHGNILSASGTNYYQKEDDETKFNTTYKNTYDGDKLVQVDVHSQLDYIWENFQGDAHIMVAAEMHDTTFKYTYNNEGLLIRKQELSGYGVIQGQPAETEDYKPTKGYNHEDTYNITYKDGVISEVEHSSRDTDVMYITKMIYTHEAGKSSTIYAEEFLGYKQSILPTVIYNIITGTEEIYERLDGTDGNDIIYGLGGYNRIDGGAGADIMYGGEDTDYYFVDNLGDVVVENGNEGHDSVDSTVSYTLGAYLENLDLIGNDNINGTGNELDNYIYGNSGNNILDGGAGNDYLQAGTGNDTLTGGTGKDTFWLDYLNISKGKDIITDFSVMDDKVRLPNQYIDDDFKVSTSSIEACQIGVICQPRTPKIKLLASEPPRTDADNVLSSEIFKANATGTATDSDDRILYNTTTGDISYDSDGNGAGAAKVFATLSNIPKNLSYENFTLESIITTM